MKRKLTKILALTIISTLIGLIYLPVFLANAAALTLVKDTLNRLKASQTSGITHKVILTTVGAVSGGVGVNKIIITAPDADDSTWCATAGAGTATGCTDESSTSLPGTLTIACVQGAGASSYDVITVSGVNDLTGTTKYCVDINDTGTGSLGTAAAGSHTMTIATNNGTADVDTGNAVIQIVADDQVAVTATVPASLTFTVTGTSLEFGTLSTSASTWADASAGSTTAVVGTTLEAGTNSTSGYAITINGTAVSGQILYSTATTADSITAMATEAVLAPASEQFGIRITSSGGSGVVDTVYDSNPADTYALVVAAFPDAIAASATQSATTTYSVYYAANIASDTEAHTDYTTTLTYIATGNF